jgi:hypothetical protein
MIVVEGRRRSVRRYDELAATHILDDTFLCADEGAILELMLREVDLKRLTGFALLDALSEPRCAHPWYLESGASPPGRRSAQAAILRLSAAGSRVFVFDCHLAASWRLGPRVACSRRRRQKLRPRPS